MHTPGSWEAVLEFDPRGQPVPYYRGLICLVENKLAVVSDGRTVPKEEWEANARLIAAAPDLLEALKKIEFDWDGEPEDMFDARAAIKKAEQG